MNKIYKEDICLLTLYTNAFYDFLLYIYRVIGIVPYFNVLLTYYPFILYDISDFNYITAINHDDEKLIFK